MPALIENIESIEILLVDDVVENLQILATCLSAYDNVSLSFATSGFEALEAIEEGLPDMILLDINMPGMSGLEVCEKIKQNPEAKKVPVIFLTASNDKDMIVDGLKKGAVDYITKPYNLDELLMRIKTHLDIYFSKKIIQMQNEELSKANKSKDTVFEILSNELVESVNSCKTLLESVIQKLAKGEDNQEDSYSNLRFVSESLNLSSESLHKLLAWHESEKNVINLSSKPIDINLLVNEILEKYDRLIADKKLSFKLQIKTDRVKSDKKALFAILDNLISNAIKFSNDIGEVEVEVKQVGERVVVRVKDSGFGIHPDRLSTLFQLESARKSGKVFGAGLAMVNEYVSKLGGTIDVESKLLHGSVFTVTIPLVSTSKN